ncbi:MAG TPA: hypothetical protein EYN91_14155 [Candidatus Melainabacteria bacterium]|nr:hypothetical protein [Candidatus Melainabacteria bacterium]HIN66654.1 hypothetical protein [Candidatus Obscuribacterales bacterium]
MLKINRALPVIMSALIVFSAQPAAFAADGLNFKIYSPETSAAPAEEASGTKSAPADDASGLLKEETPTEDKIVEEAPKTPAADATEPTATSTDAAAAEPTSASESATSSESATTTTAGSASQPIDSLIDPEVKKDASAGTTAKQETKKQVLQGFVRVVPKDTKIPIIMDTAVDSDTSQEGDEFAARTAEDLSIDGQVAVPAGSIIKGRIARITLPRALNRSGHVALKFDTVTTPDNKQIPIVANLVARGGVVHAKRGLKDIAIDVGAVSIPVGVGLGIGLIAGNASSSSSIGAGGGAVIGAGIGAAIGLAVLLSKKGKRVDVRPGDELKIELAEELAMPTM